MTISGDAQPQIAQAGQHFALHVVADVHLQRIAFVEGNRGNVEIVLIKAHALPLRPTATAHQRTRQRARKPFGRIPERKIVRFFRNDVRLEKQGQAHKRIVARRAQTESDVIDTIGGDGRHGKSQRVVFVPAFDGNLLVFVEDLSTDTRHHRPRRENHGKHDEQGV